jgi:tetratricopeptide (TPR) repeat protein
VGLGAAVLRDGMRLVFKKGFPIPLARIFVFIGATSTVALAWNRAEVWTSDLLLWRDTVQKFPQSAIAHNNLAMAEEREGRFAEATSEYEKVLILGQADGSDNLAYNNLALLHSRRDLPQYFDLNKAIVYLQSGIARAPKEEDTFTMKYNLALAYLDSGDKVKAKEILVPLKLKLSEADARYIDLRRRTERLLSSL